MCIKHIKKYTQCPHTGVKIEHCEIYKANPDACHKKEKCPETINGHCRKCGGGPQPEPVITYVDFETISSWNRESASSIETPSSLNSGVELMRKGSQKAVGGVKRFIGSITSNRSSGGSSSLLDAVSETESPSRGGRYIDVSCEALAGTYRKLIGPHPLEFEYDWRYARDTTLTWP